MPQHIFVWSSKHGTDKTKYINHMCIEANVPWKDHIDVIHVHVCTGTQL